MRKAQTFLLSLAALCGMALSGAATATDMTQTGRIAAESAAVDKLTVTEEVTVAPAAALNIREATSAQSGLMSPAQAAKLESLTAGIAAESDPVYSADKVNLATKSDLADFPTTATLDERVDAATAAVTAAIGELDARSADLVNGVVPMSQLPAGVMPPSLDGYVTTTDPRLSDARPPTAHAGAHRPGGADALALTAADVGALASGGTASAATKLAASRTVQTNLASTAAALFDGTANVTPGVTGILPVANGGTGVTTPRDELIRLLPNGNNEPTGVAVFSDGFTNPGYTSPAQLVWIGRSGFPLAGAATATAAGATGSVVYAPDNAAATVRNQAVTPAGVQAALNARILYGTAAPSGTALAGTIYIQIE